MPEIIKEFYYSDASLDDTSEQHQHNLYQIIYVTRGSVEVEITGQRQHCVAPGMIFISNYEPHMIKSASEDYSRYVLTLNPPAADRISPPILQTILSIHPIGFEHTLDITPIEADVNRIVKLMLDEWDSAENDPARGVTVWLNALLHRLYRFTPRHFSNTSGSAKKIVASVRTELENAPGRDVSLEELAAAHFVSRYYLAHIFKSVTGYSVKEYQLLCRVSLASERLMTTKASILDISLECGFQDLSNFSRYFKKITGMTPTEFRRSSIKSVQNSTVG